MAGDPRHDAGFIEIGRSARFARGIFFAAALLAASVLAAPAQPAGSPRWAPIPPSHFLAAGRAALERGEVTVIDVPLRDVSHPGLCGRWAEGVALACARLLAPQVGGGCVIYTSSREAWIIEHELAHCGGWNTDHTN